MNLKQLRYFCEAVGAGSSAQAARQLFVAPTAISMQVTQLEAEIGGALFDRASRPMELTALGRFLYPRAVELLAQFRELEDEARRVAKSHRGWLGVGFTRSAMLSLLPAAIRLFHSQFPDVRLELVEVLSEHQPEQLSSGAIHVGISRHVNALPNLVGFNSRLLFSEPLLAAIPAHHPLTEYAQIPAQALGALPFISYPKDPYSQYASRILATLLATGIQLDVQYEAMEIHTALGLVSAGLGITCVGESVTHQQRADIVFRPIHGVELNSLVTTLTLPQLSNPYIEPFLLALSEASESRNEACA